VVGSGSLYILSDVEGEGRGGEGRNTEEIWAWPSQH
jgi:hypothetical protein